MFQTKNLKKLKMMFIKSEIFWKAQKTVHADAF